MAFPSPSPAPSSSPPPPPPPKYASPPPAPSHGPPGQLTVALPDDGWLPTMVHDKALNHLQEIVQTPQLQHALVHHPDTAHPSLRASTASLHALIAQNRGLAESLKQLEAHVQHQRDRTQARLLALRALERQWKAKQAAQDEALRAFSPPALYQRLTAAVTEQEALCRGLEESFVHGEGEAVASEREVADFVKRLREGRTTAYLRAERKARWDEGRVGGWR